ncbi:MAG: class I SAM-dependent methyltransferase [Thermoproteota archaeon]|nr:class I SAM-dependent methyltransferase [Thermoproteota archaeon]
MSYTHSLTQARAENHASVVAEIIQNHTPNAKFGLDVGAGQGNITNKLRERTGIKFIGLEPHLPISKALVGNVTIVKGSADTIPFDDETFDVVTLISVYEHLFPAQRLACLKEINRVLKDGGILAGQIPNMYFPIEIHSKLLFQSYLPKPLAEWYLKTFSTVPWKHNGMNWFRVGLRQLRNDCYKVGFVKVEIRKAKYPSEVIPSKFRWATFLLHLFPLGYYFCFRKEHTS